MRRRQYVDVRPWRQGGREALQAEDARHRLELLEQQLSQRLEKAGRITSSPTTIPPHNPNFVGRREELRQLRSALALGRIGAITALHGLGGMGKSALAFEYAHAYADDYPGGRYLIPCAQVQDIRQPLVNLAALKGVVLTDEDRKDLASAYAKVRAAFETGPRSLWLLDNVDDPNLISPSVRGQYMPSSDSVHIVVTTRLEPDRLGGLTCLPLDTLPEEDALLLLEAYRSFQNDAERQDARAIVRRLGGYALAVEVVGVYLWKTADEGVTYRGYLLRLESEGLPSLDSAAADERVDLSRHQQKTLSKVLEPTLAKLSPPEKLTIEFAALLPPDCVPLPWLKAVVVRRFPEYAADSKLGYPDPWRQLTRRLMGFRLLTKTDQDELSRIHRLTQDVVIARIGQTRASDHRQLLVEHARTRVGFVEDAWGDHTNRWEVKALTDYAQLLLDQGDREGCVLSNMVSRPMQVLGNFVGARELLLRDVAVGETVSEPNPLALVIALLELGTVEGRLGNFIEGRKHLQRAIRIGKEKLIPEYPAMAQCYHALGDLELHCGNPVEAKRLILDGLEINKKAVASDDPRLAGYYHSLGLVERNLENLVEARKLFQRAIEIVQRFLPPDHPSLAPIYASLAVTETELRGNLAEAREMLRRAIASDENVLSPDHPSLASKYSNLSELEYMLHNLPEAQKLLQKAISIEQKSLPPNHAMLGTDYACLAWVEHELGNDLQARELLQKAIAIQESSLPPNLLDIAKSYCGLGTLERGLGNMAEARQVLERAILLQREALAADDTDLANTYTELGAVERSLGNLNGARKLLQEAISIQQEAFSSNDPRLAQSYFQLAIVEKESSNFPDARRLMQKANTMWKSTLGPDHAFTINSAAWLSDLDAY